MPFLTSLSVWVQILCLLIAYILISSHVISPCSWINFWFSYLLWIICEKKREEVNWVLWICVQKLNHKPETKKVVSLKNGRRLTGNTISLGRFSWKQRKPEKFMVSEPILWETQRQCYSVSSSFENNLKNGDKKAKASLV